MFTIAPLLFIKFLKSIGYLRNQLVFMKKALVGNHGFNFAKIHTQIPI